VVKHLGEIDDEKILKYLLKYVGDYHSKVRLLMTKMIKKIEARIDNKLNNQ